ncbi:HET-domain-containing protein [Diaporthe amygdali]|uniref:HET-domain-containing protein n=1 Tax=Phomopsis amygdali TaxID=1214568 RepID=UPI0022FDD509|nr:HET-domain-containing protein [Diaporthe amygdali]KAJ0122413.1 HET-domain-containing protein [Diaporthe amygdali]
MADLSSGTITHPAADDLPRSCLVQHDTTQKMRDDTAEQDHPKPLPEGECVCPVVPLDRLCPQCRTIEFDTMANTTDSYTHEDENFFRGEATQDVNNNRVISNTMFEMNAMRGLEDFHLFQVCYGDYKSYSRQYPRKIIVIPSHKGPGFFGRHIDRDAVDLGAVCTQLQFCEKNHELCKPVHSASTASKYRDLGLRAIDVDSMTVVPIMWENDRYVALSYVWGSTHTNEEDRDCELPSRLPQVVQDAVVVTKSLGHRFLWVDRYCIPQTDMVARQQQIQAMGEIYLHSSLTITAAAGMDADYGLPGISTRRSKQDSIRVGQHCLLAFYPPIHELPTTKWASRGWTYQEGLLSTRRLIFTQSRVFFECREALFDEYCTAFNVEPSDAHWSSSYKDLFHAFRSFVPDREDEGEFFRQAAMRIGEFSQRELTYDGDALNAMAGVLSLYPDIAFCGLPVPRLLPVGCRLDRETDSLTLALAWTGSDQPGSTRRHAFPSWTWAGWKKCVYQGPTEPHPKYYFKFLVDTISVQFKDTAVDWEAGKRDIMARSRAGTLPMWLQISGWSFTSLEDPESQVEHCIIARDSSVAQTAVQTS